ncbi:MAG: tetratricopeptide repeat protein, partial [Candidatus Obscuribacterales bacterium]|nr:tetratricopeptide repeat protein [Candidatus Obscuribacterales bacterium]
YDAAEGSLLKALELAQGFGSLDKRYSRTLEQLSETQWYLRDLDKAQISCNQLLEIHQSEADPVGLVVALSNLAMINHSLNNVLQGEFYYLEALKQMRIVLGPNHAYVLKLKSFYADLLTGANREQESRALGVQPREVTEYDWQMTRVIQMMKERLEQSDTDSSRPAPLLKDSDDIVVCLKREELALILDANELKADQAVQMEDMQAAEQILLLNLRLAEQLDDRLVFKGKALERLGTIKHRQGLLSEAVQYLEQAEQANIKVLGVEDLAVANIANLLARIYYEMVDYKNAEKCLKKSITIFLSHEGELSENVGCSVHNLATVYHVQKMYDHAEAAYKRALHIKNQTFGPDHPETRRLLKSYGELLNKTGRQTEVPEIVSTPVGVITGSWHGKSAVMQASEPHRFCPTCGSKLQSDGNCSSCI